MIAVANTVERATHFVVARLVIIACLPACSALKSLRDSGRILTAKDQTGSLSMMPSNEVFGDNLSFYFELEATRTVRPHPLFAWSVVRTAQKYR
jgi:hypothetical protein